MTPDAPAAGAAALFHLAFYRFVKLVDPDAAAARLRELTRGLTGSVLVAPEGINGVLAGSAAAIDGFEQALRADPALGPACAGMPFKRSACRSRPFGRMKVQRKAAIVTVDVPGPALASQRGKVTPTEWRELIRRDDVVVLDNRNSFEYRLGRFRSAVDPQVRRFGDFPAFVEAQAPAWKAAGKRVAMYCTGGIRCEKTSAWMEGLGLEVLQLDGGILNYFQAMPDAELDWEGECFVFDNRIALDTRLQETDTTAEQVYADEPDGAWRLQRARRLDEAA
ncbi:hypothetical protein OOT46_30100 [Aquabacterium sp. A7-Y]|uniref:oxygen-dependent tRNA uridine(34) hydroxylase TrhO n=1 Tax=Aquabacterium sp. A7-Y TaxID=1349605 RepID=UPI00223DF50E|nr:rhodanese-like domain-containing protein [Aquabacterium sp. A7-Y]MCW7542050.1 hypothetical protein [Aquabacterium sp. A7-Y]